MRTNYTGLAVTHGSQLTRLRVHTGEHVGQRMGNTLLTTKSLLKQLWSQRSGTPSILLGLSHSLGTDRHFTQPSDGIPKQNTETKSLLVEDRSAMYDSRILLIFQISVGVIWCLQCAEIRGNTRYTEVISCMTHYMMIIPESETLSQESE